MKIDKYKKKTFSKYWNNFGKNSKKIDKFSSVLKKIKQVSHKILGFKIKLIKSVNYESEEFTSYQTDSKIINYRNSFLSKEIKSYLSNFKINSKINEIKTYIKEVLPKNKIKFLMV